MQSNHLLVIGGSQGIGLAVASHAVAENFDVTIASRRLDKLRQAQQQLGQCEIVQIDVAEVAKIKQALEQVRPIEHIFYSAASEYATGKLTELTLDQINHFVQQRIIGLLSFCRLALQHESLKSLTVVSGMLGQHPRPNTTLLSLSCAASNNLVKTLAQDFPQVRFNSIAPGVTTKNSGTECDQFILGQKVCPQTIAKLALTIIDTPSINGANFAIDAGQPLRESS